MRECKFASTGVIRYKGYSITYHPKPIPTRDHDFEFVHDDYDGAPDSHDHRSGTAGNPEDAKRMIDDIETETLYSELQPEVDPMARMYDLSKKGPGMTPEENKELKGLIGRHGRPKFMASWIRQNCRFAQATMIPISLTGEHCTGAYCASTGCHALRSVALYWVGDPADQGTWEKVPLCLAHGSRSLPLSVGLMTPQQHLPPLSTADAEDDEDE